MKVIVEVTGDVHIKDVRCLLADLDKILMREKHQIKDVKIEL